jgi:hypothetical protein
LFWEERNALAGENKLIRNVKAPYSDANGNSVLLCLFFLGALGGLGG